MARRPERHVADTRRRWIAAAGMRAACWAATWPANASAACRDLPTLDRWFDRAVTATSAAAVLADN